MFPRLSGCDHRAPPAAHTAAVLGSVAIRMWNQRCIKSTGSKTPGKLTDSSSFRTQNVHHGRTSASVVAAGGRKGDAGPQTQSSRVDPPSRSNTKFFLSVSPQAGGGSSSTSDRCRLTAAAWRKQPHTGDAGQQRARHGDGLIFESYMYDPGHKG
ncbi:unnamed protein product [Pleuronectes platessa]|uniref:Uncharacterized protein n=1 Tax=Pleuronectes platessa TaxID=8262 RepID=A0A9N7UZA5_PLEPL|nr:unnamed protein product [Pleuronectes platessa]